MDEFLMESELTEIKACFRSFVKQITVRPGSARTHYTIPTLEDNDVASADFAEIALRRQVMSSSNGMVGGRGLEPLASAMSTRRSNQLS